MPPKKKTTEPKKAPPKRDTQKYVRNIRNAVVALRYGDKPTTKYINLQGRGNRGDTAPLPKEAFNDPKFRVDEGVLYEIISSAAAKEIIEKQTHNQQSAHPALSSLRNEKGESYDGGVVVLDKEAGGKVVAHLDVDHEKPTRQIGITRVQAPGTVGYEPSEPAESGIEGLKVTMDPVQTTD